MSSYREVFPTSTLRQSSGRPPARVPGGRGAVSESRWLGKVQGPKSWRWLCACRPRSPGHVSFDSVFDRAPVASLPSLQRSDSSASSKAGGRAGSRGGRGFRKRDPERLLEYRGNSRLSSVKHVVTHREELRSNGFNSQVCGDFPYLK